MVVEPRTLRQVDFRYRSRGYHPDDVDDFLERLADGLEQLRQKVSEAESQAGGGDAGASVAPAPAVRSAEPEVTEASMRRLLHDSQVEADLLVRQARDEAAAVVAGAEARASELEAEALDALPIAVEVRELRRQLEWLRSRHGSFRDHLVAFERLVVTGAPLVPGPNAPPPAPGPCFPVLVAEPPLL